MKLRHLPPVTRILVLTFVMVTIQVFNVAAKDLYVATSGSDSYSYADNAIDRPWSSPSKAWREARAGDTVYFRGGTYSISSEIDSSALGSADGTDSQPIRFTNYNDEAVTFYGGGFDPLFDINSDNNVIENINISAYRTAFRIGRNAVTRNTKIQNCRIETRNGGDNEGPVEILSRGEGVIIQDCELVGGGSGQHNNTSGVNVQQGKGVKILNCEIHHLIRGIYYKHSNGYNDYDVEIAYNYIHDTYGNSVMLNCNRGYIHDNLIGRNNADFEVNATNGYAGGDFNVIENNTFYDVGSEGLELKRPNDDGSSYPGAQYNTIRNNIFRSTNYYHPYSSTDPHMTSDYNLYVQSSVVKNNRQTYSLSGLRSRFGGDANSIQGTPVFVGGSSPASIADFALASGPGKSAASDGGDMGADISKVGRRSDIPDTDPDPVDPPDPGGDETTNNPETPSVDSVDVGSDSWDDSVIYHDEFEDAVSLSSKYGDYNDADGDFAVVDGVGFGGGKGLRARWSAGEVDAGSLSYMFGRNPYKSLSRSDTDFREIYWRFYMKTSSDWQGNARKLTRATIFARSNWAQAMVAHIWGGSGDDLLKLDPASGIDSSGNLKTSRYNDTSNFTWLGERAGRTPIYRSGNNGVWYCVEAHVKLNDPGESNGIVEFWVDGELEARRNDLNLVGSWSDYGINVIMLGNYINGGAPRAQERYIDNLVIATEPIGPATTSLNPTIYASAFVDADANDVQGSLQAQVAENANGTGVVWDGSVDGQSNMIRIDANSGTFQGTLAGKTTLEVDHAYYTRVRLADSDGNLSDWSSWTEFRTLTGETEPPVQDTTPPANVGGVSVELVP